MPKPGAAREETVERALEMISNTAPFGISHHPAMAVPCGMSHGLPVSMMLIGKHWDEPTIYRAAAAFEGAGDWKRCSASAWPRRQTLAGIGSVQDLADLAASACGVNGFCRNAASGLEDAVAQATASSV